MDTHTQIPISWRRFYHSLLLQQSTFMWNLENLFTRSKKKETSFITNIFNFTHYLKSSSIFFLYVTAFTHGIVPFWKLRQDIHSTVKILKIVYWFILFFLLIHKIIDDHWDIMRNMYLIFILKWIISQKEAFIIFHTMYYILNI